MPGAAPLKQFLTDTIPLWDHAGTPANARENLWKIVKCGTAELGADLFASATHEKIVYHTCKSRFCCSCGARFGGMWQAEMEAIIPDIPYQEINFTMPRALWPLFQHNRDLLNDLPAIGARAIEYRAGTKHNARVILMVVQQTYGGLSTSIRICIRWYQQAGWTIPNSMDRQSGFRQRRHKHEVMLAWRFALLAYFYAAIKANVLRLDLSLDELTHILHTEGKRNWNIFVSRGVPKNTVIDHIGRYIRKPPIAQYRLTRLNAGEVQYLAKDTRKRCLTPVTYTNQEFLALLIPHIADRYCNSMRYFGLLAPRSKRLLPVVFDLLKQKQNRNPLV